MDRFQEEVFEDCKKKKKAPNNRRDKSSKNTDSSLCLAKSLLVYQFLSAIIFDI